MNGDRIRTQVVGADFRHSNGHVLPRQCVSDEDNEAVMTSDEVSPVGDISHRNVELLANGVSAGGHRVPIRVHG